MAAEVITSDLVQSILERWVCSKRYNSRPLRMPSSEAIAVLAGFLDRHRLAVRQVAEFESYATKTAVARRKIEEAVAVAEDMQNHLRRCGVNDIREGDGLLAALAAAANIAACLAPQVGPGAHWRQYVIAVRGDLWACLRETNPDLRPHTISREGPYERFTAAIVPAMTGEETTPQTVAKAAMKLRATGRWFDADGRFGRIVE